MGKVTKAKAKETEKDKGAKISSFFKKSDPPTLFTKIGSAKAALVKDSIKSENNLIKNEKISPLKPSANCTNKQDVKFKLEPEAQSSKTPTKVYKNSVKRLAKSGISPSGKRGFQSAWITTSPHVKRNILPEENISIEDDDLLCELLNELNYEDPLKPKLTSIKTPTQTIPAICNKEYKTENKESKTQYKECKVRPADQYNRHTVTAVNRTINEVVLDVKTEHDDNIKQCILRGFWCDSHVSKGDIVNILAPYKDDIYTIDDKQGLLVVNPDILLSGTSVVSSVFCMRRSVLNEKFKGSDSQNIHMLYGSIIHCLFQQVLKTQSYKHEDILKTAQNVLKLNKFIHEMYSQKCDEATVLTEIKNYLQPLQSWLQKHTTFNKTANNRVTEVCVSDVQDIEENIWSPRFGIKGKIDLTVKVKIPGNKNSMTQKTVPLELKTGRTTYSIEHKGQVTLYSMMSSDRREDPEEGILLYLKEPSMKLIPAKNENKKGLLQLRNEMAYYISNHVQKDTDENDHVTFHLGKLPEPINSQRACSKCPQLLNCSIYQRYVENYNHNSNHAMHQLVPDSLSHLTQQHLDYFIHWMLCMDLEKQANRNTDVKQLWCLSSSEREISGDCISGLVINKTDIQQQLLSSQKYSEGSDCLITFTRHSQYAPVVFSCAGIVKNDLVVISTEDGLLLALCTGIVQSITDTIIQVAVDRDTLHTDTVLHNKIYRVDKCNNFNTMGYLFTNLSKLMANEPHSTRLRELIIDKKKPEFINTLSKRSIEQVKKYFKVMNKPQKTAILKVLMSQDYILIKGFPGTGKTSTIVCLVKILVELGQKVLLTSYTHSAVDNILLKLKKDGIPFLRLGRLARIHPDIHGHSSELLTSKISTVADLTSFYDSYNIVATSCLGINHAIFTQRRFDVCIVDEASQVLQPACLGPIFLADRFILVGDSKQLSPVVQSRQAKELGMEESLFISLDNKGASFELNLQYRMNRIIMNLSNELVYEGALRCGSVVSSEKCLQLPNLPALQESPDWLQTVLSCDINLAAVFCNTKQVPGLEVCDKKRMIENPVEAEIILIIIQTLIKAGIKTEDVGIIAPYRSQVKLIHAKLQEVKGEKVEVNTVDQYQGRDKEIIIISFVRSYDGSSNATSGQLLHDIRRLNVAVSRAKVKLILLGDISTLQHYNPVATIITSMTARNQIIDLPCNAHQLTDSTVK